MFNRKKTLKLAIVSMLTFAAQSVVVAAAGTPVLQDVGDTTFIIGKKNIVDTDKLKESKNTFVLGSNNTLVNPGKKLDTVMILGTNNALKGTTRNNTTRAENVVIIGNKNNVDYLNTSSSYNAIVIGAENKLIPGATGYKDVSRNVVIGTDNTAANSASVNIGWSSETESNSVAIGTVAKGGTHSVSVGFHAESKHSESVRGGSTSVGYSTKAYGTNSVSVGSESEVKESAEEGVAIGYHASVSSSKSFALGSNATVAEKADGAIALGDSSSASVAGGIALGKGSKVIASSDNLGYNFETKAPYDTANAPVYAKETTGALSIGSSKDTVYRRIVNVAAGREDTDVVNVGQLKDALKTLNTQPADMVTNADLEANYAKKDDVANAFNDLRNDTNVGIANVAALSALHMQPTDDGSKFQIMAGVGFHSNKRSVALGAGYQMTPTSTVTMGIAAGSGRTFTGNVGFSWKVGTGNAQSMVPVTKYNDLERAHKGMVQTVDELKSEVVNLKAELEALKASVLAHK